MYERATHVVQTLAETGLDMAKDLLEGALCCGLVVCVEGGRVDEGEGEGAFVVVGVGRQVNVEGDGPDMRGVAAGALDELGGGGELVVGDGGGDGAGVEEEAEEGGLAGAPASDHERVAGDVEGESVACPSSSSNGGLGVDRAVSGGGGGHVGWVVAGRELVAIEEVVVVAVVVAVEVAER